MVDNDDVRSEEEEQLRRNFEKALLEYMCYTSDDNTMLLTGYIVEAAASGVTGGERVLYLSDGTAVQRLGLLAFIEAEVTESAFGS